MSGLEKEIVRITRSLIAIVSASFEVGATNQITYTRADIQKTARIYFHLRKSGAPLRNAPTYMYIGTDDPRMKLLWYTTVYRRTC